MCNTCELLLVIGVSRDGLCHSQGYFAGGLLAFRGVGWGVVVWRSGLRFSPRPRPRPSSTGAAAGAGAGAAAAAAASLAPLRFVLDEMLLLLLLPPLLLAAVLRGEQMALDERAAGSERQRGGVAVGGVLQLVAALVQNAQVVPDLAALGVELQCPSVGIQRLLVL
eukprot:COSAG01_NODE_1781_length_9246_cov_99.135673_2_plen_166_part_00